MSLIQSKDIWLVLFVMIGTVALGVWLEKKYKWAAKISTLVIVLALSVFFANVKLMPTASPVYDMVWDYMLPMALPLLLFKSDIRKICKESGKMMIAFILGAIGTVIGAFVSFGIFQNMIPESKGLTAMMTGTYIGGSVNFAILAKSFHVSESTISAATIADNLNMAIYIFVLLAIPVKAVQIVREEKAKHYEQAEINTRSEKVENSKHYEDVEIMRNADTCVEEKVEDKHPLTIANFAIGMAVAIGIVAVSTLLADFISSVMPGESGVAAAFRSFVGNRYMWITTLSVAFATIFSKRVKALYGLQNIGMLFIYCFMFVIGAPASIPEIIHKSPIMLIYAMVIVIFNMLFVFLGGKLFRIDRKMLILASNANIGGPTTAASFAIAKGWEDLMGPAILVGCFGYAIGNYLGLLVGNAL